MTDYLPMWLEQVRRHPQRSVRTSLVVTGAVRKPTPPELFAIVEIAIEPADQFQVDNLASQTSTLQSRGFPDAFIFGLLDILMADVDGPLLGLRVVISDVRYHDIDTNEHALVMAGRDAGQKICQASK